MRAVNPIGYNHVAAFIQIQAVGGVGGARGGSSTPAAVKA